nr:uncharacterized protein LOC122322247 [Drosophila bipectinata]
MPKSNKNQKPPVEEKALVKASPKRKKFTPAKASGKAKVLPGGLTGSPKVSSDDDGIWFECNLPFRVNIPFPVCMQKFFGFPGISLSNTDPKNGNLKAIMPATNGDLPSGFQSETPGGCNKNTCPKRKLGRRGNKICPCETATQTGEEENDPLLACLEQIKDKLQNLSPQVQAVQAKPCVCFLAEKGTNVREKTIKRSSLSLDSPEDGKRNTSFESRKGNCYCSPVASKVSSLYQKSRDPDWKEAVLEEAHPSYTRINKPSTESDVSVSAKDYREGDDPVSVSGTKTVTKESSRISKKPPQVTKTPSYESKSEEECLCDPNYQSPDEEVQKPTGRSQRRRVNEDSYNSGSRDNRVYNSSSGYSQSGNSSQVKGSHPSRIIASCLPNCTDSCSFKKRTHQAKNNSRTNNKKAPETVTLMQPRRFRSTESTQRGKDAIESGEDMDTKNTVLIETRIPCDRKNLMQTCGRPPCNFHRLQYSGVPPVVEQRNMYMRPPPPQTVPQRSHPNDEDYLIDPRDHLPPLASAPVMGNPYPMPMINAFHRTSSSYPYTNLHQASCRDPYSCPAILKNNIRSMPKGFYEETLQKYNITRMDSDFQPPTLRSDILYQQLNGAPDRQFSNHLNRPMMMKSSGYNQHHMPPPNPFQAQPSHSMFGPHQNVKLEGYDFSEYQI